MGFFMMADAQAAVAEAISDLSLARLNGVRPSALLPSASSRGRAHAVGGDRRRITGWGTDEEAIWRTLRGKSAQEIEMLSRAFKNNYGRDLKEVLDGELSGADKDHAHALLRGDEHRAEVDAVRVKAEIDGSFGDDQEILKLIESRHGRERTDLALAFAARNGGPSNERAAKESKPGRSS